MELIDIEAAYKAGEIVKEIDLYEQLDGEIVEGDTMTLKAEKDYYTAEQMQEYAKSKVAEAFEIYDVDLHDEVLEKLFEEAHDEEV